MKAIKTLTSWLLLATSLGLLFSCSTATQPPSPQKTNSSPYPATQRGAITDHYAGQTIADPYRWLENTSAQQTKRWLTQQRQYTQRQLAKLSARQFVKQRVTQLYNVQQTSAPAEHGGKLFFWHNDGLENQPVLYVQDTIDSAPRVAVDPNSLNPKGSLAVVDYSVSPNGQYLAYALSENGTDWRTWKVVELSSGATLPTTISGTKFTPLSWYPDSNGFYYSRYPKTEQGFDDSQHVDVYYHKLGDSLAHDSKVTLPQQPKSANAYPKVTEDGQYLLLRMRTAANQSHYYIRPLAQPKAEFVRLLPTMSGDSRYLGSHAGKLYFFHSDNDGGSVVTTSIEQPERVDSLLPPSDKILESAYLFDNQIIAHYLDSVQSRVVMFDAQGAFLRELALPGLGSVSGFSGAANAKQTFFKFSSFTEPGKIYRYQVKQQRTTLWRESSLPIDSERYTTQQVFVDSSDNAKVPVFIIRPKEVDEQTRGPTLLHVYGGFGYSLTPHYNAKLMAWLELGGSVAVANVRGGGELGSSWHIAGKQANKPNAITDLLNSARWLIDNGYTRPQQLALYGRGHGALLVTSAMLKEPQTFAAAVPAVGLFDLMRYQHANTNARSWQSEFGMSSRSADVKTLLSYSPLHNVTQGVCYPATLLTTGTRDQRVAPWHSYKMAATLQHAQDCAAPILLQAKPDAGHGDKNPIWMQVEQATEQWLFLVNQLNFSWLKNSKGE